MPSESMIVFSSNATLAGRAGLVPVALTTETAVTFRSRPVGQVADRDLVLDPVALPVHLALVQAGQVQDRLTHGLGRDGAGVDADAAEHVGPLDDRHAALQLRRGDGRLLAARPGPDDEKIEVVHASSVGAWSPL
jgi:hypothetical protein